MKSVVPLLLATFCMAVGSLRAEKPFEGDSLGNLKLGQSAADVAKALGKPASKGKDVEWEAIGEWVQEWHFPKQGLTLAMNSEKKGGAKTILSITAGSPCQLATSRGIQIGSPEAKVAKAYHDVQNKEEGEPGKLFVAGSVYGGVMFHLAAGKVVQIFIGAAAE
ncbi:MAG TPA: hypothetical protein VIM61_07725 [Chthoniobacterales bacterium]|jgi:hypothetical protein